MSRTFHRSARERSCESKVRYDDRKNALTAINRLLRAGRVENLRAYPCRLCWGWHITKKA